MKKFLKSILLIMLLYVSTIAFAQQNGFTMDIIGSTNISYFSITDINNAVVFTQVPSDGGSNNQLVIHPTFSTPFLDYINRPYLTVGQFFTVRDMNTGASFCIKFTGMDVAIGAQHGGIQYNPATPLLYAPYNGNYTLVYANCNGCRLDDIVASTTTPSITALQAPANIAIGTNGYLSYDIASGGGTINADINGAITLKAGQYIELEYSTTVLIQAAGYPNGASGYVELSIEDCGNILPPNNKFGNPTIHTTDFDNQLQLDGLLSIYPNPASSIIQLMYKVELADSPTSLQIYNAKGDLIRTIATNQHENQGVYRIEEDISDLAEGLYFVKYLANSSTHVTKFIKVN